MALGGLYLDIELLAYPIRHPLIIQLGRSVKGPGTLSFGTMCPPSPPPQRDFFMDAVGMPACNVLALRGTADAKTEAAV